jgi:hypothetical protein
LTKRERGKENAVCSHITNAKEKKNEKKRGSGRGGSVW